LGGQPWQQSLVGSQTQVDLEQTSRLPAQVPPAQHGWPRPPQATQLPPLQVLVAAQPGEQVPPQPSSPQVLPAQFGTHWQTPPLPQVEPALHALPAQQACPGAPQATQVLPLHTFPGPQPGRQVPPQPSGPQVAPPQLGAQTQVPPEQVAPVLQALPAQQAWPMAPQVRQAPPWQTLPAPQPGRQVPPQPSGPQLLPAQAGAQAQVPFEQVAPGSHCEPSQQAWPTAPHVEQLPLALQVTPAGQPGGQVAPQPSGPQLLPAHEGVQAQVPPWQLAPLPHTPPQHGWPAAPQPTQAPAASQASRLPQLVPAGASPVTAQIGPPDEQAIWAVRHTGPLQAAPGAQSTQVPVDEHTLLLPQAVPGVTIPLSVQTGSPEVQAICAV
jgi:hypothetical protein